MRRYLFALLLGALLISGYGHGAPTFASPSPQLPPPFPLPAPLYFLTADHQLVRMGAEQGEVTPISDPNQPVADFDTAPDGDWVVYRTLYEGRVVVSNLRDGRGQVLALSGETPPPSSARQTIAWAPRGDAIAYVVTGEGVRIRSLIATEESAETFVRGSWGELYWGDERTLLVSDEGGHVTRITRQGAEVTLTSAPDMPARPQPCYPAYLSAQGVVYNGTPIPNTAGALAFDWGPPPLPSVQGLALPADLFFLADGALWRVPRDEQPAYPLVRNPQQRVWAYSLSPDGTQIAYLADAPNGNATLHILEIANGSERTLSATLSDPPHDESAGPAWQPNGNFIAYADGAGVWLAPLDDSAAPTLLLANQGTGENVAPNTVRHYLAPRWSADGAQLLLTVRLWESRQWLIYDLRNNTSRTLNLPATSARWADETHLLAWSSGWSVYFEPTLYAVALNAPESEQLSPLLTEHVVYDVRYTPQDGLDLLAAPLVLSGPAYAEVLHAPALTEPLQALPLGAFVDSNWGDRLARLSPPAADSTRALAVLRFPTQEPDSGIVHGELSVVTAEQTVRIAGSFAAGRVHMLRWGR